MLGNKYKLKKLPNYKKKNAPIVREDNIYIK